jgi:hypothetical protein
MGIYQIFRIHDELSGVVETQTQNRLCSGRTSLARDFRSIPLALIGCGIEPNNAHFWALYELRAVGNKFNLADWVPLSIHLVIRPFKLMSY